MLSTFTLALLFVAALQLKHIICDGPLQTLAMVKAKRHYLRGLGLAHAGIHTVGTLLVAILFGIDLPLAAKLALLDGFIHYHVDWSKENLVNRMGWMESDGPFWWAFTTDQALHHATYLVIGWLAFRLL